ncbi:MAG: T9SS type A sorting domain-containing protein [Bacteroidota bacterium]|nr:T9SS type A sorting domain-containing protein [Bacteroidota bacterium]
MKRKTLLLLVMTSLIITSHAQNKQKEPVTGYAITASEKGGRNWKEVRLVNVSTGEELKTIYKSTDETQPLNARTKNPVAKKDAQSLVTRSASTYSYAITSPEPARKKIVNLDEELSKAQGNTSTSQPARRVMIISQKIETDKPFATNSAAIAYDKKHDRLYYTPMGINELRYIDLKSNKIYYFENEAFGQVKGFGDVPNQITRMVIASDGNGYALSNDANHLIRFTTGKNPAITDLGALGDDAKNGNFSVHGPGSFGGDMIADVSENLYLVNAFRQVFKISIASKSAIYLGSIKGLPRGFTTNGAMVEEGSKVIVASSESTDGYYRFDLNTLQAERVSPEGAVFNASDLANGNLAFDKKNNQSQEEAKQTATDLAKKSGLEEARNNGITVYPNPVTNGSVNVSFTDQPAGKYQVQFLDLSGKLISTQELNIANKLQVHNLNLPGVAKGNYLIKVVSEANKVSVTSKIMVQ